MANNSLKVSELPQASNVSSTDRVMVLYSPNSNPSVRTITVANLTSSFRYANTTAAGVIKVGNNLSINATGFLNSDTAANLSAVNTSIVPANTNAYTLGTKASAWSNIHLTTSLRFPNNSSEGIPSLSSRTGEKIILKDLYELNTFSYSIGLEANSMWFSVEANGVNTAGYKWYNGNTQLMKLDRDGHLQLAEIHTRRNTLEDHFTLKTGANLEYKWEFSNTGTLTVADNIIFPSNTSFKIVQPPATSNGTNGDTSGSFAANSSYVFYCTTDYTDGSSSIWKRIALSNDTW